MRRPFVTMTFTLAAALAPAVLFAQAAPPAQQPAAQQPPATTAPATAAPAAPAEPPKVGFTTPAGILLVQIKPDQTAVFEEMIGKLKAGLAKTEDAALKQQASGFKVFKAAEPFGANALYVVMMEPASANAEYELFAMMQKTMTDDEKRAPETAAMWKRYTDAFAAGLSKLSLTPIGG
ncbi:MAG: hypothetical protein ABI818_20475 [Acidobacteriota bacterium]